MKPRGVFHLTSWSLPRNGPGPTFDDLDDLDDYLDDYDTASVDSTFNLDFQQNVDLPEMVGPEPPRLPVH